jgi:hypothetical protein
MPGGGGGGGCGGGGGGGGGCGGGGGVRGGGGGGGEQLLKTTVDCSMDIYEKISSEMLPTPSKVLNRGREGGRDGWGKGDGGMGG